MAANCESVRWTQYPNMKSAYPSMRSHGKKYRVIRSGSVLHRRANEEIQDNFTRSHSKDT